MLKTPVAVIVFNRPEFAARVLKVVAQAKPRKLFVIADGPRPESPTDIENCAATRALFDELDWECEVNRNYSEVNLGCAKRPPSGISWVFDHVEEAIILEDDCVPDVTFFRFCEELLSRYRDDHRVMNVSGSIFRREPVQTPFSYCFSQLPFTWGWATWRRAWRYYDVHVSSWPQLRNTGWLAGIAEDEGAIRFWTDIFDQAHSWQGETCTWDYQWVFSCWLQRGLSILPRDNLVTNIGCGEQATHCFDSDDPGSNLPTSTMSFPLTHPPAAFPNLEFDRASFREIVRRSIPEPPPFQRRVRNLVSRLSPPVVKKIYRSLSG